MESPYVGGYSFEKSSIGGGFALSHIAFRQPN
jgi:hypothetical protein